MPAPEVKLDSLKDLRPDPRNANRGTARGHGVIAHSVSKHGAGRSGLAANDGTMIAGNQTLEEMQALGLRLKPVHTTGDEWVVVIRDDIEPGSEQATLMALEDNRATQVGLDFDPAVLAAFSALDIDLSALWTTDELQALVAGIADVPGYGTGQGVNVEAARLTLAERFVVPPFSVLDARQGYWQERKRAWLSLGIQSELGRGGAAVEDETTLGAVPPNERTILGRTGTYKQK